MQRTWIALGSLAGLVAVAMAALAAHGLRGLDPASLATTQSGIEMEGWHALALLVCGLWAPHGGRLTDWAGTAFAAGIMLFCGAVYTLGLGGKHTGMMAPLGGSLLMLGWALLGASAIAGGRRTRASVAPTANSGQRIRQTPP